jgi:hypothetical protein
MLQSKPSCSCKTSNVESETSGTSHLPHSTSHIPQSSLSARLARASRPAMVQVSPGEYIPASGQDRVQQVTLARWTMLANGNWKPVPFTEHLVKLDSELAALLGFPGQFHTLYRLADSGFVEIVKVSPQVRLINLDSWFNHLRRCAENPEFWENAARRKAYNQSWVSADLGRNRRHAAKMTQAPRSSPKAARCRPEAGSPFRAPSRGVETHSASIPSLQSSELSCQEEA